MSARGRILDRVRAAACAQATADGREAAVAERLGQVPAAPAPRQARTTGPARLNQFMAKAENAAATVGRVSSLRELPRAPRP